MAQANAHLKPKSKSETSASPRGPYAPAADNCCRQPPKPRTPASDALCERSVLPKALHGKKPIDYVNAPVDDADAYALIVEGDCMAPMIVDGDIAVMVPHKVLCRGTIVAIHFKDGSVAKMKRLRSCPSPFFFNQHPDSEVNELLQVEQLNPPKRLMCLASKVEAIHAVAGVVRAGEWIRFSEVHMNGRPIGE